MPYIIGLLLYKITLLSNQNERVPFGDPVSLPYEITLLSNYI